MTELLQHRITAVWGGLIAATILSWMLATDHGTGDVELASVLILLIAFLKIRFVGRYFMELRDAPVVLLALFEGWVVVVCAAVTVMYLVGS